MKIDISEKSIVVSLQYFNSKNPKFAKTEKLLMEFMNQNPRNEKIANIIKKCELINSLFKLQLNDVSKIALHIQKLKIDGSIKFGIPQVVNDIAAYNQEDKRKYLFFASAYCCYHRPKLFPIFGLEVEKFMVQVNEQNKFSEIELDFADYYCFKSALVDLLDECDIGIYQVPESKLNFSRHFAVSNQIDYYNLNFIHIYKFLAMLICL